MARFLIQNPNGARSEFNLGKRPVVMVGRELDNSLILKDPHASRKHFYIRNSQGKYTLVNLSHTHGTIVNGEKKEKTELQDGDLIEAGSTRLHFMRDHDSYVAETKKPPETLAENLAMETAEPQEGGEHEAALRKSVIFSKDEGPAGPNLRGTAIAGSDTAYASFEEGMNEDLRKRFRLVQEIGQQMVSQLNLNGLLQFLLDQIFEILPADNGIILLVDRKIDRLRPMAVRMMQTEHSAEQSQTRVSQTLLSHCFREQVGVLSDDAQSDGRFQAQESIVAFGIRSVMVVPLVFRDEILGAIHVDTQDPKNHFSQMDLELLTVLANQAALSVRNSRLHDEMLEAEKHRANLERYFSPQIAEKIAANEIQLDSGGKSVEATVLFSDIRNFTSISEQTDPGQLVRFLNQYFTAMADIVFECNGTLDKYIGDALVAVFGSPIARKDDPFNAARCALRMIQKVREMQFEVGEVQIGIGIHYGKVIHGNIGSEKVMQLTCIGDTVNTASRLSDQAKPNQVLLSAAFHETLLGKVQAKPIGPLPLKGKKDPIDVLELTRCGG